LPVPYQIEFDGRNTTSVRRPGPRSTAIDIFSGPCRFGSGDYD
jgi:hypothetical protein